MKRQWIAWLCLVSLCLLTVGCSGTGKPEPTPASSGTVSSGTTGTTATTATAGGDSTDVTVPDVTEPTWPTPATDRDNPVTKPSKSRTTVKTLRTTRTTVPEENDTVVVKPEKETQIKLKRGINVSGFQNTDPYAVTLAPETYTMLKNSGFDHVRLPVNFMARFVDFPNDTTISEDFLRQVDIVVNAALDAGLAIILDFHGMENSICQNVGQYEQAFYDMWEQVAIRYQRSSDNIYFELINEPSEKSGPDPMTNDRLNKLLRNTVKIIRRYNPTRPILYAVNGWNGVWNIDSVDMPSVEEDSNLIVAVHLYEDMKFTHQGASWDPTYRNTGVVAFTDSVKKSIESSFQKILAWQKAHGGRMVHIGEFGVNQELDNQEEVKKYAAFFAGRCKELNLPWCYWELTNSFGAYDTSKNKWKDFATSGLLK